jgi:hypothetical protein
MVDVGDLFDECVRQNPDDSYTICLNSRCSCEQLRESYDHALNHIRYNDWEKPEGAEEINKYEPGWNDADEDIIKTSGHGGGDYLTVRMFLDCIKENRQPEHPFDIRSAIAMSSVAILAHRSALYGGTYDIPDFENPKDREKYENDRLTPFYGTEAGEPTLPCCTVNDFAPSEKQLELYRDVVK